jgi:thiosulfate/3-mercaptopyruvate sulfurtransferase
MLPLPEAFAKAASDLGVSSGAPVIIYGQSGIAMGPCRAWWMFRIFGHDNVRVVNGGLPAWKEAGLPVETTPPETPPAGRFKADFRRSLLADLSDVVQATGQPRSIITDVRPAARFAGATNEPREGLRSGHIPGSVNMPFPALIDPETGKMKPPGDLRAIFENQPGWLHASQHIASCGSGITACVLALAAHECGIEMAVYDGSWAEYGQDTLDMAVATGTVP